MLLSPRFLREYADKGPFSTDIFATASRDGTAMIWDLRVGRQIIGKIKHPYATILHDRSSLPKKRKRPEDLQRRGKSVTGVEYLGDSRQMVTSGSDG